jgi:predicted Zn-dependent protease
MKSVGCFCIGAVLCALPVFAGAVASGIQAPSQIDRAFARLYNFDFRGAHAILDQHIAAHPSEPLPFAVRSAAYLFYELDRLGILESEFLVDDKRITEKKELKPDPAVRSQLFHAVEDARSRAMAALSATPDDEQALFAMCITMGVVTDYTALVEKRQMRSLSTAKRSNLYARHLLRLDPQFYDAYLTTGLNEYLVGSLPFFVRWFVRFDDVRGSKNQGIQNLRQVAHSGHYLKPFAKIMLAIVYLREKKPRETEKLLIELAREYPQNPLIRKELAKISARNLEGAQYLR